MGHVCILEPDNKRAKFRQTEPLWYLALQHASLSVTAKPFARNNKHETRTTPARGPQEAQKRRMRLALRQTMQIEPAIDCLLAACDAPTHAPSKRRKGRRPFFLGRLRDSFLSGGRFRGWKCMFRQPCFVGIFRSPQRINRSGDRAPQHPLFGRQNATPLAVAGTHCLSVAV
jgi:hypothetical protein